MQDKNETKIVTVDDGSGPVKAAKDSYGRLLTRDQVQTIRDRQQADLDQVTQAHDKLAAHDETATANVVRQFKDRMAVQLTVLDRQKAQLQETLTKLEAGDGKTVETVVGQMVQQLATRVATLTQARDASDALLAQLD